MAGRFTGSHLCGSDGRRLSNAIRRGSLASVLFDSIDRRQRHTKPQTFYAAGKHTFGEDPGALSLAQNNNAGTQKLSQVSDSLAIMDVCQSPECQNIHVFAHKLHGAIRH